MAVAIKALHTTSQLILLDSLLCDHLTLLEGFEIMTDTQAIDVVTFDLKGTRIRCLVSGPTDYQMNYS